MGMTLRCRNLYRGYEDGDCIFASSYKGRIQGGSGPPKLHKEEKKNVVRVHENAPRFSS